MGALPWTLIGTVILKLMDFFFSRHKEKGKMKKQMLEFLKEHDKRILDNARLKREYERLKKEAEAKRNRGSDTESNS